MNPFKMHNLILKDIFVDECEKDTELSSCKTFVVVKCWLNILN